MLRRTCPSTRLLVLVLLIGSLAIFSTSEADPVAAQAGRMDYHDVVELGATLQDLADGSRHARLFTIGHSIDYKTDPDHPVIYPIYAIRISGDTHVIQDDIRKNSILFEAGSHPREWLTTESTLMLAEYLVEHAEDEESRVPRLLANVDVWIIPLTNPAGRALDDTEGGDPRNFSIAPEPNGWRGNGDTRGGCDYGVNVARNFSRGWNDVNATDCENHDDGDGGDPADPLGKDHDHPKNYRGFAPFSTLEATALREFVQNHGISMAVVVHSNSEQIWNRWGNEDVAGVAISGLAQWAWAIGLDDPNLFLVRDSVGGGFGQFSAWLSDESNTPHSPDVRTTRAIQTIFVELPFQKDNYKGDYRYRDDDGSNGFHPSGARVQDLIQDHFIPMAKVLIGQSASPGCNTGYGCPDRDFGLVGAKIGLGSLSAGALITNAAGCLGTVENGLCDGRVVPARDYLTVGQNYLHYRVQNFSAESGYDDPDVRMTFIRTVNHQDWSESRVLSRTLQSFRDLSSQAVATGRFELNIDRVDTDYEVVLEVRPAGGFTSGASDDFQRNDKKVFRFRSRQ